MEHRLPASLEAYVGAATSTVINPLTSFGPKGVDAYVAQVSKILDKEGLDSRSAFLGALLDASRDTSLPYTVRIAVSDVRKRFESLSAEEEKHRRRMIGYGRFLALAGEVVDHTYTGPKTVGEFRAMEREHSHELEMQRIRDAVSAASLGRYNHG